MSALDCAPPDCPESSGGVDTLIIPRAHDLGGFEVRRALPSKKRQMVGPFIFFDQMGPAEFINSGGIDVRPHPHIGISTVTYLYSGEFELRDSLGTNNIVYPGEVNWMVAGKGITHSERTSPETRKGSHSLFGIQTWVALPDGKEEIDPAFEHHAKDALPLIEDTDKSVKLILGRAYGQTAPVSTYSDLFYADAVLMAGGKLPLPDDHEDRGVYVLEGSITVAGDNFEAGQMLIFRPSDPIMLIAGTNGARLMLLGGATLGSDRYIEWNFVASDKERIREAVIEWRRQGHDNDWSGGKFKLPPGDDEEFIPL